MHWPPKRDCGARLGCLQRQMFVKKSRLLHAAVLVVKRGWSFSLTATFPLHVSGDTQNFSIERKEERETHFAKTGNLEAAP